MSKLGIATPEQTVAVAGHAASGKDTVAQAFTERGFTHLSLSDVVREELASRGIPANRATQNSVANEMRHKHGGEYWLLRGVNELGLSPDRLAVSGVYAVDEAQFIIDCMGGDVVAVHAADEDDMLLRYQRLARRTDGSRDRMTYEEFVVSHARENSGETEADANVSQVLGLARFTVVCAETAPKVSEQVQEIINRMSDESNG